MKAYDDKKFTLNNKISDFIPELKDSDKKNLAVKDLLYHQSGLTPTINFYLNAIDKDSYKGSLYSNAKNQAHPVRFDARTYVRNDFSFLPNLGQVQIQLHQFHPVEDDGGKADAAADGPPVA